MHNSLSPATSATRRARSLAYLAVVWLSVAGLAKSDSAASGRRAGAIYTQTNSTSDNAIAVFSRTSEGTTTFEGLVPTRGTGTGGGLGSQGALALSEDGRWLFAVNAGSHEISVFSVRGTHLSYASRVSSFGLRPISLTTRGDLLYVLNAGGVNNITGFTVGERGEVRPLPGSAQPLSGDQVQPGQIQFNPAGDLLVVTEKSTNVITTYEVGRRGLAHPPRSQPSSGVTPFGCAFRRGSKDLLVVCEAAGGAQGGSTTSSYRLFVDGELRVVSPAVPNYQTSDCWLAITKDGRFVYTANAGSSSISGYRIAGSGQLSLLNPDGVTAATGEGSRPRDLAVAAGGSFLYMLDGGLGNLAGFRVGARGGLMPAGTASTLPHSCAGLAAR